MMKPLNIAVVIVGLACRLHAAEYFVEKSGDDGNPGTRMQPFKSIQKAADVMLPGDVCTVSRGVYREVIRPAHSGKPGAPLLFQSAPGETVSIGGADELTGWQRFSGPVYRAQARAGVQVLVDDLPAMPCAMLPSGGIENTASWYFDAAGGYVYLKLARNEAAENHVIQWQTRDWGLDAGGLSHIYLKGFNLHACGINLAGAKSCKIEDCHLWWSGARLSPTNLVSGSSNTIPFLAAIVLGGKENEVVNSSVIGNSGFGLAMLPGSVNNLLVNSLFKGLGQNPPDAVGILAQGTAPVIRQVSVMNYAAGALVCSNVLNARVENNDFHHTGTGTTNGRVVRLTGDGKGTVLAGNWIHDNAASAGIGLGLEGPVENFVIRQNVIWGQSGGAIMMTAPTRFNFIFNNTCAVNGFGIDAGPEGQGTDYRETRVMNNILAGPVWPSRNGEPPAKLAWKSNYTGKAPGFVDETNRNFRLAVGSPCIDVGQEEPEFTDEFSGKLPDMGAYEFGKDYPVPGCHVNESANKVVTPVVKILLEAETDGAEMRYTLDGRNPDLTSPVYTGAVAVGYGAVVKVKAFRPGMEESGTAGVHVRRME